MAFASILDVVGNTPLIQLNNFFSARDVSVYVKLESQNPGGSSKDRIAVAMIQEAIKSKRLKRGGTVVEATGAGNTGIGIAMTCAVLGYACVLVIPDKVSDEKRNILRAYGAKLVVAPTNVHPDDPESYYRVADRLAKEIPHAFQPNQYSNKDNPHAHYLTTGPEIWRDTNGNITHIFIGMGTGGTISGVGKFLKEKNPNIIVIGIDHVGSTLQEYHRTGKKIDATKSFLTEGIGEDFIPETTNFSVIDDILQVDDKESFLMARELAKKEGILAGGTSGAILAGIAKYLSHDAHGIYVAILPDTGRNYISKCYNDNWMMHHGFLDQTSNTDV